MGNRAVITTQKKDIGVYLHYNGGRDSIEAFLTYCRFSGFRRPEVDNYGWARLCEVIANFFTPGDNGIGIDLYERLDTDNGDNGVYVIKNWRIVDRLYMVSDYEQNCYKLDEMLLAIDQCQPQERQLGEERIRKLLCEESF
ncbi:MAG: hypothetical protein K6G51_05735 [Sphaerochaetaceae bacterium]|nr:hypothetical protein [Sphaerochaetaceae bacterium]